MNKKKNKKSIEAGKKAGETKRQKKLEFNPFFIKSYQEEIPRTKYKSLDKGLKGIYVLLKKEQYQEKDYFNVLYIGRSEGRTGIKKRLDDHHKNKKDWTHFSIFIFYENINFNMLKEIESLLLIIYRNDKTANSFNKVRNPKGFKKLKEEIV